MAADVSQDDFPSSFRLGKILSSNGSSLHLLKEAQKLPGHPKQTFGIVFLTPLILILHPKEKETRDKGVEILSTWLKRKTNPVEMDYMKVWRALFYCMWMSDKPVVQHELAMTLASLLHLPPKPEDSILFIQAFLKTMIREWAGIDKFRLEKYLWLMRFFVRNYLSFLKENSFDDSISDSLNMVLLSTVLNPSTSLTFVSMMGHFIDVFFEELIKVDGEEWWASDPSQNLTIFFPWIELLGSCDDISILRRIIEDIFEMIVADYVRVRDSTMILNASSSSSFSSPPSKEHKIALKKHENFKVFVDSLSEAVLELAKSKSTLERNRKLLWILNSTFNLNIKPSSKKRERDHEDDNLLLSGEEDLPVSTSFKKTKKAEHAPSDDEDAPSDDDEELQSLQNVSKSRQEHSSDKKDSPKKKTSTTENSRSEKGQTAPNLKSSGVPPVVEYPHSSEDDGSFQSDDEISIDEVNGLTGEMMDQYSSDEQDDILDLVADMSDDDDMIDDILMDSMSSDLSSESDDNGSMMARVGVVSSPPYSKSHKDKSPHDNSKSITTPSPSSKINGHSNHGLSKSTNSSNATPTLRRVRFGQVVEFSSKKSTLSKGKSPHKSPSKSILKDTPIGPIGDDIQQATYENSYTDFTPPDYLGRQRLLYSALTHHLSKKMRKQLNRQKMANVFEEIST